MAEVDLSATLTLKDVARRAGVSPATASRVLNGVPTVREPYRRLVLEAATELAYRPNRVGRNLRRQRAEMIGVVVSDIENPHFTTMVRALEDAAYPHGRVLLCNTDEEPDKQRAYLGVLASERVLGVVLSATEPDAKEISELLDLRIPVVAFDRPVTDPRADDVFVDNAAGGRRATEHLLRAGHRRIGFVSGLTSVATGADRLLGYERAMREAGLEPVSADGSFRVEGGREATERLFAEEPELTGIVVANNLMALGALRALQERAAKDLAPPALVAFDDPPWAPVVEPALTTLAQPVRAMSESAVALLFERMAGARGEPRRLVFDFELRVRDSCRTRPKGSWREKGGESQTN